MKLLSIPQFQHTAIDVCDQCDYSSLSGLKLILVTKRGLSAEYHYKTKYRTERSGITKCIINVTESQRLMMAKIVVVWYQGSFVFCIMQPPVPSHHQQITLCVPANKFISCFICFRLLKCRFAFVLNTKRSHSHLPTWKLILCLLCTLATTQSLIELKSIYVSCKIYHHSSDGITAWHSALPE